MRKHKHETDNPRLPIGPFREWLLQQEAVYGSRLALAVALGVSDSRVRDWTRNCQHVTLDSVDAAGCAMGDVSLLRQLYPETYQLPEWLDGDEVAA